MIHRLVARNLTVLVCVAALAAPAAADDSDARATRLLLIGAGAALYATGELVVKDALTPDVCRWCDTNAFDDSIRNRLVWSDTESAHDLSNLAGYAVAPLGAAGLLLLSSGERPNDRWTVFVDDLIPVMEAVTYSQLLTNAVKYTVGRQRPFVHYSTNPDREHDHDDNLSFFSGHAALGFGLAFATGAVAHRRGYRTEPLIWSSLLVLAAGTSYLRIAADRHYASDVLVGTAVGVAAGLAIPRLTGSLPREATITATPNGVSLVGVF